MESGPYSSHSNIMYLTMYSLVKTHQWPVVISSGFCSVSPHLTAGNSTFWAFSASALPWLFSFDLTVSTLRYPLNRAGDSLDILFSSLTSHSFKFSLWTSYNYNYTWGGVGGLFWEENSKFLSALQRGLWPLQTNTLPTLSHVSASSPTDIWLPLSLRCYWFWDL